MNIQCWRKKYIDSVRNTSQIEQILYLFYALVFMKTYEYKQIFTQNRILIGLRR